MAAPAPLAASNSPRAAPLTIDFMASHPFIGEDGEAVGTACLPFALHRNTTLKDLLDGVIAGYEVGGRMGEALRIRPGMHVDACWPALGAAAGGVRLCGGSARQARDTARLR